MTEQELIALIHERRETFALEECRNTDAGQFSRPDDRDWEIGEDTKREAFDRALSDILDSDAFAALFERVARGLDDGNVADAKGNARLAAWESANDVARACCGLPATRSKRP